MRRSVTIMLAALGVMLGAVATAQAYVVPEGPSGHIGVATVPGTLTAHSPTGANCMDPWLAPDLGGPSLPLTGLCWNGGTGSVLPATETFAITWDPIRHSWSTTRNYLEGFLKNVANGTGSLNSPYALTSQYRDGSARAENDDLYGGGCVDLGKVGGSTCRFPTAVVPAAGRDYSPSGQAGSCGPAVSGQSYNPADSSATSDMVDNGTCITDQDIQGELKHMISDMGLKHRLATSHDRKPLLVLMTPPGVEVCGDPSATWCSANSNAPAKFCSYHSWLTNPADGSRWAYVVQPWTAYASSEACDLTNAPPLGTAPTATQVAIDAGLRIVSPLSQGQIDAIVNPYLNAWSNTTGAVTGPLGTTYPAEMSDRCPRTDYKLDMVGVGGGSYPLQREFNNAGVLETDPNAPACALLVHLTPTFVPPSPIDPGDVVAFDGSVTDSTLMISQGNYHWDFGDGTSANGASVVHTFAKAGVYKVTLKVLDRGGYTASVTESVTAGHPKPGGGGGGNPPPPHHNTGFKAHMQLMPEGLKGVLRSGISARIFSNRPADAITTVTISRHAASKAHIKVGRNSTVVIGRGTVRGISAGKVNKLRIRLPKSVARKLRHMKHVSVSVHITLFAAGGQRLALDAAGRY